MQNTRELLRAVKLRHRLTSDYQLAKFLNVSRQRISGYQSGAVTLGDEAAIKVADALGIERGRVLAIVAAERAQSDQAKKEWLKLAGTAAAFALLVLGVTDQAAQLIEASQLAGSLPLYIMSNALAALVALVLALLLASQPRAAPLAIVTLAGCTSLAIDYGRAPPPDWPQLRVEVTRQDARELQRTCRNHLWPQVQTHGCAFAHFESGTCYIYVHTEAAWIVDHERAHCAGYDHPGESTMRDAWETWKRNATLPAPVRNSLTEILPSR